MPLSSFAGLRPAETIDSQAGSLARAKRDSLTMKASTRRMLEISSTIILNEIQFNEIQFN